MKKRAYKSFKTRALWRGWLAKNHETKKEIWVLYCKKHTGKTSMVISEGAEEALCYGWIDTALERIDEDCFILRYTPRRKKSIGPDVNKDRVKKNIKEEKMTKARLKAVKGAGLGSREIKPSEPEIKIPADFKRALEVNEKAKEKFKAMPASNKKVYIWWITSAKHEEARARRIEQSVKAAMEGSKYPSMF